MIELVTEITLYPDGLDPENDEADDASVFGIRVVYRGKYNGKHGGGYAVEHGSSQLARVSRKWHYVWRKDFRRWQYRWPDLESALEAAREEVNNHRINGRTWAQWQEFHGEKAGARDE